MFPAKIWIVCFFYGQYRCDNWHFSVFKIKFMTCCWCTQVKQRKDGWFWIHFIVILFISRLEFHRQSTTCHVKLPKTSKILCIKRATWEERNSNLRLPVLKSCTNKSEIVRDGRELEFRGFREMWREWILTKKFKKIKNRAAATHTTSLWGEFTAAERKGWAQIIDSPDFFLPLGCIGLSLVFRWWINHILYIFLRLFPSKHKTPSLWQHPLGNTKCFFFSQLNSGGDLRTAAEIGIVNGTIRLGHYLWNQLSKPARFIQSRVSNSVLVSEPSLGLAQ